MAGSCSPRGNLGEAYRLDPTLRFRVVSRDPRCRILADSLPADAVEVVPSGDVETTGALLRESLLGFMVRPPGLVNEVSCPMKLGEYLASGAAVVASRCGWDAERLIERHEAGLLVEWSDPPAVTARAIVDYVRDVWASRPVGVQAAADELSTQRWAGELGSTMAATARQPLESPLQAPGQGVGS